MATAYLIHGYLGAGKTTFARRLEQDAPAVRFTPDEWMARLFGEDPPADLFREKAAAVLALMEPLWTRCLHLGSDVVLDYGFWGRAERDRTRRMAEQAGGRAILYSLQCDEAEALRRIALRNAAAHRSLLIGGDTYEMFKARWEPLGADEAAVRVRSDTRG